MAADAFQHNVLARFDEVAIQEECGEDMILSKSGLDSLHIFLDSCRDAESGDVRSEAVSEESLKVVFDSQGWSYDRALKRDDLIEVLTQSDIAPTATVDSLNDLFRFEQ